MTYTFHQDSVLIKVNDSIIADIVDASSHSILNANIYLSDPYHLAADVIVSGLKITSSNSKQPDNAYNYLCDFNNRFTVLSGAWTPQPNGCGVTTNWAQNGAQVWMGQQDTSTLQWNNYKIEGSVKICVL